MISDLKATEIKMKKKTKKTQKQKKTYDYSKTFQSPRGRLTSVITLFVQRKISLLNSSENKTLEKYIRNDEFIILAQSY